MGQGEFKYLGYEYRATGVKASNGAPRPPASAAGGRGQGEAKQGEQKAG
jgi:hypothetical protein